MDQILVTDVPELDVEQARNLLLTEFGVAGEVERLPGERDLNFRVRVRGLATHVLKITNSEEGAAALEFQAAALLHIAQAAPELPVPRIVRTRDDAVSATMRIGERKVYARLLSHLDGQPCIESAPSAATRRSVGRLVARLDRALAGLFDPAAGREVIWDLRHAGKLRDKLGFLGDGVKRELAARVLDDFDAGVAPRLARLPRQVIHNDVNQNNLLIDPGSGEVSGIIDFGDMVNSHRVNDLAITVAHQLYRQPDPLAAAADVIAAYVLEYPLDAEELDVLFHLVRLRLVSREIVAAWRHAAQPTAPRYDARISDLGWQALDRLDALDGGDVRRAIRAAAGLPWEPPVVRENLHAHHAGMVQRRERLLGPMYKQFYQTPFLPVKGEGVWVTDATGRVLLDAYNNVPHVGHCHPHVVAAQTRQARLLNTHTRYLHDTILQYAEKLSATLPDPLNVCLFVCSGTEANELAWRIACANTGGDGAIVTRSAFHGNSTIIAELDTSTIPVERLKPWVATVPAPAMACYRPDRTFESASDHARHYDAALHRLAEHGHRPSAFFTCSVFASDGLYSPPSGYLGPAMARLKAAGVVVVADEVQSGLGRPGTHMWGFQHAGFTPDIVTMGKPMGNGLPLAVVVTRRELLERFVERERYFNTFGGNPVVCAAGLAVLEVIEREDLQRNALEVGRHLRESLASLMSRHECIADVRGSGLFVGVELVDHRGTNAPAPRLARDAIEGLLARGVMVGITGPHRNLLKIRPPMVFSRSNADQLVDTLDDTLSELGSRRSRG